MADIQDGLTTGDSVDSDAGFLAALAEQAGVEVPAERIEHLRDTDRSVASGLVEGPARDERGRYASSGPAASTEPSEETGEVVEEPAEGEPATEAVDPNLAAYLEQHGGDTNAALQAALEEARNAQSLIGRQGNEVGELRQQLARLEGMIQARQEPDVPPTLPIPASEEVLEGLESMAEQYGHRAMMGWVAENRPDLIDQAISVWDAEDPVNARMYASRYATFMALEEAQAQTPANAQSDPFVESLRQQHSLTSAVDQARAELSISEGDWTTIRDEVIPAFEDDRTSFLIKNAVLSEDPATRLQGMKDLLTVARGRVTSQATEDANAQVKQQSAEQAAARKEAARVATGSLRPVEQGKPGEEMTKEERTKLFHERLLATETTSVADGLTYGK